jgi:hypothetical protein
MAWILSTDPELGHDAPVDTARAELLRELLRADPLIEQTTEFARTLTGSTKVAGGFLLVGTPTHDPWHLTAHLDDEARYSQMPELSPTLVRWSPPKDAPAHLAVGIERLEQARKNETVLVVSPETATEALLERAEDARRIGATVLALAGDGDSIAKVAHEALLVPSQELWLPASFDAQRASAEFDAFDATQHMMSLAAGEAARMSRSRSGVRARWTRFIDSLTGEPARW